MDNALIAVANGGLCNRLKTVVSAHRIASETGRTLYVYWNRQLAWDADGTRLFLPWPGGWHDLFAEPLNELAWAQIKHLEWLPKAKKEAAEVGIVTSATRSPLAREYSRQR